LNSPSRVDDATQPSEAERALVFWENSLGCALVCRHLARKINLSDPGKAYLAGLLHDLGIIVNLWVLPKEFRAAWETAKAEGIPEPGEDALRRTRSVNYSRLALRR
jgi:HD-like signal output (HDOD) protein